MNYQRRPLKDITPEIEDAGLFKRKLVQVSVDLVPQVHRSSRQDVVVRGFVNSREISVVFAGRRAKEALPLEAHLKTMLMRSRQTTSARRQPDAVIETIRFKARIEGAWRPRFERDPSGWETKSYQLLAARWSIGDADGNIKQFGSLPMISGLAPHIAL